MTETAPRLAFEETAGAGPPIVLLHGFGGCAAAWRGVLPRFGRAAIAFDLPGHAGSLNYPGFGSASFAAKAVIAEMDQRGVETFHLAGHSMGGAAAALIACRAPYRVLSLTLLAPGGFGAEINAELLRAFGKASTKAELAASLELMFAPGAPVPASLVNMLAIQRGVIGQTEALAHVVSKILSGDAQGVLDKAQLASLSMPASVLWGAEDRMVPSEQMRAAPDHFKCVLLPRFGHMLPEEAPEEVLAAILSDITRAA